MDLLTLGLIGGTAWAVSEGIITIKNTLDKTLNTWKKLELENYKIIKKEVTNTGNRLTIQIAPKGSVSDLETHKEEIEKAFCCKVIIEDIPYSDLAVMELIAQASKNLKYEFIELTSTSLLIGYDYKGEPIIVDMLVTPHVGVTGLSNNGKSKCIELALNNLRGVDIHLVNCMDKDFKGLGATRINGNNEIMDYLKEMVEETEKRDKPLYIVIDEYNVLSRLKNVDKAIQDLLSQARHRNTYIICIMQLGNKEDCKFKNLFNCRLVFRCVEESIIRAFLGCSVEDTTLKQREFILYHDRVVRGKTYDLDFK